MDDHFNELAEHWTKFLAIEADGNSELGVWASGNARDILGVADQLSGSLREAKKRIAELEQSMRHINILIGSGLPVSDIVNGVEEIACSGLSVAGRK